jgi:hypothetical protein
MVHSRKQLIGYRRYVVDGLAQCYSGKSKAMSQGSIWRAWSDTTSFSGVTTSTDITGNERFYMFADGKIYIGIGTWEHRALKHESRGNGLAVG